MPRAGGCRPSFFSRQRAALGNDAGRGMEATHQFISVTWEKTPFDVLWAEARQSGCRVCPWFRAAGVLNQGQTGAIGRSFLLAMSSVRGGR